MISIYNWTALHVACSQGHSTFVEKLIQQMPLEALSLRDGGGCTALHYAAKSGSFECVQALLDEDPGLTLVADNVGHVPLVHAAKIPTTAHARQKEMVWQLCLVTKQQGPDAFVSPVIFELLVLLIANEYLDIAFYLVKEYPFLAAPRRDDPDYKYYMLSSLIDHPSAFQSQSRLGFWENILSYWFDSFPLEPENIAPRVWLHAANQQPHQGGIRERDPVPFCSKFITSYIKPVSALLNRIYEEKSKHMYALELVKEAFSYASLNLNNAQMLTLLYDQYKILPRAAEKGILEIYTTCFEFFPDAIWLPPNSGRNVSLQTCIEYRQEKIFNFFLESMAQIDFMCNFIIRGDTALHFAAKLAPLTKLKAISGSPLQVQSELQWFKAVEKICQPDYNLMKDSNQKTAQKVFTEEHKELFESGEKWMKDTASSCMLVATLIATVVFAAAFTVPGGNQDNGLPLFLQKTAFLTFSVSDSLALFSSSTSILMFLSILTSRYGEEDFLFSLPGKLIIGLASLFFAIVTLMVAFCATLSIVLGPRFPLPTVTVFACIPVSLFIMLQLPLFIQMVKSTFWSDIPWR